MLDPEFSGLPLDQLSSAGIEAIAGTKGVGYGDIRIHRDRVQGDQPGSSVALGAAGGICGSSREGAVRPREWALVQRARTLGGVLR